MGRGWFGVVKFRIAKFIQPEKNCGDRAVLVAISIPIFTAQLEKAREATDAANLRAAYAELMADAITEDGKGTSSLTRTVDQTQTAADWDTDVEFADNFDVDTPDGASGKQWTLAVTKNATIGLVEGVKATLGTK